MTEQDDDVWSKMHVTQESSADIPFPHSRKPTQEELQDIQEVFYSRLVHFLLERHERQEERLAAMTTQEREDYEKEQADLKEKRWAAMSPQQRQKEEDRKKRWDEGIARIVADEEKGNTQT